jgi:hypothetical protein
MSILKLIPLACSCAWISVGTYFAVDQTLQWRMPLALACIGPLAMIIGLPFIPGQSKPTMIPRLLMTLV